jgi:hypothetical protein
MSEIKIATIDGLKIATADELRDIYCGAQNKHLDHIEKYRISDRIDLDYEKTIKIEGRSGHKTRFTLNLGPKWVKNIRLNVKPEHISYVDISIGGQRIDRAHYRFYDILMKENFNDTEFAPNDEESYIIPFDILKYGIPQMLYHDITIDAEAYMRREDWILSYDVYNNKNTEFEKCIQTIQDNKNAEETDRARELGTSVFHQFQWSGEEKGFEPDKSYVSRLNFNHPINMLVVESNDDEPKKDIYIIMDGKYRLNCKLTYQIGKNCVYKFGNYVNFSRIDNARLYTDYTFKSVGALGTQWMVYMSGMAGMIYPK